MYIAVIIRGKHPKRMKDKKLQAMTEKNSGQLVSISLKLSTDVPPILTGFDTVIFKYSCTGTRQLYLDAKANAMHISAQDTENDAAISRAICNPSLRAVSFI